MNPSPRDQSVLRADGRLITGAGCSNGRYAQIDCDDLRNDEAAIMRRMLRDIVRDALRRRKDTPDVKRTRITDASWHRPHAVASFERDPSEWVYRKLVRDWDSVKKGRNKI